MCVTGAVQEFVPDINYGTITEISGSPTYPASHRQRSSCSLPPYRIGFQSLRRIYQREKYESMRVSVNSVTVIAPSQGTVNEANATATSNGTFFGVLSGTARPFREPGVDAYDTLPAGSSPTIPVWDDNPEILRVNTTQLTGGLPVDVTTGATVSNLIGVLDYKFGQYTLLTDPGSSPTVTGNAVFTAIPAPLSSDLTVGSLNLQHFYDTTDDPGSDVALTPAAFANRLTKASLLIRNVIRTPDILALEEVENLATAQALAAQIDTDSPANPPHYQAFLQPGNDISDINNAFLVKSTVTVVSVTQYGKDTTYIDPTSGTSAILNDRPPLVLKATAKAAGSNQTLALTVIANHLRSLISVNDNTPAGTSTNGARVRAKREAGAEFLANLVQGFQAAGDKVIVVGDLNAYDVNDGYADVLGVIRGNPAPAGQDVVPAPAGLVNPILTDAVDLLSASQRYSDTFDGERAGSRPLPLSPKTWRPRFARLLTAGSMPIFPKATAPIPPAPERTSDHDPVIGYLTLPAYAAPTDVTASVTVTGSGLTFNRATQLYSGTLVITNKTAQTIAGPITVQLTNLSSGVTVVNPSGLSTPNALAPNAAVTLPVQFSVSGPARIGYTPKVFSGAF